MAYSVAWNEASPLGSDPANTLHTIIQNKQIATRERLAGIFGLTAGEWNADPIVPKSLNLSVGLTGNVIGNVTGNLTGTVLTAAQPNITFLGTLTSLTTNGVASLLADSNYIQFKGTGGSAYVQLYGVAASGHYNWQIGKSVSVANAFELIPSTVADGSTFTTPVFVLTRTGNLIVSNFTGNLTGTILTAAQANITSLGILTGLSLGVSPAITGLINLPNNGRITARNNANSADIDIIWLHTTDQIRFGTSTIIFTPSTGAAVFASSVTASLIGNVTGTILTAAQVNITSLGTLTSLIISGALNMQADSAISATKKFYLDGGGDTYIYESVANTLDIFIGGALSLRQIAGQVAVGAGSNLSVEPTKRFYLDGGGDTYIWESAANHITGVVAGATAFDVIATSFTLNFGLDFVIQPAKKIYLDGGGDTYISEGVANRLDLTVGGVLAMFISAASANFTNMSGGITANSFTGPLTGNVTGTILTAAQGNITSLGTLTSLSVSGNVSVGSLSGLPAGALGAQTGAQITLAKLGAGAAVVNAAQQKWLQVVGSDAVTYQVPAFT